MLSGAGSPRTRRGPIWPLSPPIARHPAEASFSRPILPPRIYLIPITWPSLPEDRSGSRLAPCAPGLFASRCALLLRHVADHSCPASQDHALFIIDFACGDRIDTQQVCNLARLDNALTRKQRGKHRECSDRKSTRLNSSH